MATERIDIIVAQKGAKEVRRDIEGIGEGAKTAATGVNYLQTALKTLSIGAAVREIIQLSDAYTGVTNRLKIATKSSYDLQAVQQQLFNISQKTRSDLETNAQLYGRLSIAAKELGADQNKLLTFTEAVGNAIAISGGSTQSARGSLIQLSQAIGTTIVRAEEFNSILEGAPRIAQAAAAGLDKAGGSVAKLRQLIVNGQVTSKEFFDAILSQAPKLASEFEKTTTTIGQSFTRLNNALAQFVGTSSTTSGGTQLLATAINKLADNVNLLGNALIIVATVLGTRYIVALGAAAIANTRLIVSSIAATRQAALMAPAMLGMGASAATASIGVTLLSRALAFFGGPIGLIITGVLLALQLHTDQAAAAQVRYNDALSKFQPLAVAANSANAARAKQAREQANAIIASHIAELESLNALIDGYASSNALVLGFRQMAGKIGIGTAPSEVIAKADALRSTIKEMRELLENPNKNSLGSPSAANAAGGGGGGSGKVKNQFLEDQQNLLKTITGPLDTYKRGIAAANALLDQGKISTEQYTNAVRDLRIAYLDTATDAASGFERGFLKVGKEFSDTAKLAETAVTNMGKNIEDAFVQFSQSGKLSFRTLIDSMIADLTRLSVRQNITQPLFNLISGGGAGGGGGGLGSLLGNVGSLFSGGFNNSGQNGLPWQTFGNVNPAGGVYTGFATGTSFTVGGTGGVDSQRVAFRASPGEQVTVTRPGQEGSMGGARVTNIFNISTPNPDGFRQSETQMAAQAARVIQRSRRIT